MTLRDGRCLKSLVPSASRTKPEDVWQFEPEAYAVADERDPESTPEPDPEYNPDPNYDPTEYMTREELDELAREAELAERDYEAALVSDALRNISKEAARGYLAKYGDAVDARIGACLEQASQLAAANHPGPALLLAATALEITIRFLLLRPRVQGCFSPG